MARTPPVWRRGALTDEFVRLRRDLEALPGHPRHVVVLGSSGGEGATSVALQLALQMSRGAGTRGHLLVEGNLRAPTLERELGLPAGPGLLDWDLSSPLPVRACPDAPGLWVVTAGTSRSSSGGPSIEERLLAACRRVREDHDSSVWDAPPVLHHGDGLDIAAATDGALVVIEMDTTRVDGLRYLASALERRRAVLLGSVLNRTGRYWPRSPLRAPR